MDARCRIELFGGLRVIQGEEVITRFRTRKSAELLAYLAYFCHRAHGRESLIELLWSEVNPESGRHRLRQALSMLRQRLETDGTTPGSVIRVDGDTIRLNPDQVETDLQEFHAALRAASRTQDIQQKIECLRQALALYRDEFLTGSYDDWALRERDHLAGTHRIALRDLALALGEAGQMTEAIACANRLVQLDSTSEEAHSLLMRLYAAAGQPSAVLRQFQTLERALDETLGERPPPAVRALYERLREQAELAAAQQPLPSPMATPSPFAPPLPRLLTRFFGRETEMAQIQELLLKREIGLVTLLGPGGSGKTRLAQEVIQRLREPFAGRVGWVNLTEVAEAGRIARAILDALGRQRSPHLEPMEQTVVVLSGPSCLLLLDNFEMLAEMGAPVVRELLERVPNLTLLVTSRQRLNLAGEHLLPIAPLPVPEPEERQVERQNTKRKPENVVSPISPLHVSAPPVSLPPEMLMQFPSVQMFVDRAQAVSPGFALTPENAGSVGALCIRLEGVPLALELAASWMRVMTVAAILTRLEDRFALPATDQNEPLLRHRSLWATIDESYRLLSVELQQFFCRLSVFRGGWTEEAVQTVCSPQSLALSLLAALDERSLIVVEEFESEKRFRMLETLREFGWQQLTEQQRVELQQQHSTYFLRLAEEAEPELSGPKQGEWLQRLEAEYENLRASLGWSLSEAGSAEGLRLCGALSQFWRMRGQMSEGQAWCAHALTTTLGQERTRERTKVLYGAGRLALFQGDYASVLTHTEESLDIFKQIGDQRGIASALSLLGIVAHNQGDYVSARAYFEESLAFFREIGDQRGIASTLNYLGHGALVQGNYASARTCYEMSLDIFKQIGDRSGIASLLNNLGNVAMFQGDYASAQTYNEEGLDIKREVGDRSGTAFALNNIGLVASAQGDYASARASLVESLTIRREIGDRSGIAYALEAFANLATRKSNWERAATLWAAAEALRAEIGLPLPPNEREAYNHNVAEIRQALGEEAFPAAWAIGRAMPLEQAMDYAREKAGDEILHREG